MFSRIFIFCGVFLCYFTSCYAEQVIWEGDVSSDGAATAPICLVLHKRYQITASKSINLGKWVQGGDKLANDACYLFNSEGKSMDKSECLKNSNDISVCDGKYHSDHIYHSKPFEAKQNRIFFWIQDSDYDDNNGALHVVITQME